MYKDQMIYKIGDLVRVSPKTGSEQKNNIGLVISVNENATIYDVKVRNYVQKFHYSFLRPLSIKNCQGGIK